MRSFFLIIIGAGFAAAVDNPAAKLWSDLKAKREALVGLHQEFQVSLLLKSNSNSQPSKWHVSIEMSGGRWREKSIRGSGNHTRIFDGTELFVTDDGGDEYTRAKFSAKAPAPQPAAFLALDADWTKSRELERSSCGLRDQHDQCVLIEVPLKPASRGNVTVTGGAARITVDLENGVIFSLSTAEAVHNWSSRNAFERDYLYTATGFNYGAPPSADVFALPPNLHEVKELTRWTPARIRQQLAGKPAPDLNVVDLQGRTVSLSSFKGKTVLLDFWTTWCPPCRADAPALDKLYKKYSAKDLVIIGISVDESHSVVEKFLKDHPHEFPVVLSTENELSRAYQIGYFPTYIIIDRDGTIARVSDGDQGFAELRKLLKKAGMEVD